MPQPEQNLMNDRKVLAKAKLLFLEPNAIMHSAKLIFFQQPKECGGVYTFQAVYSEDKLLNELFTFRPDIVLVDIDAFDLYKELSSKIKNSPHAPKDTIGYGSPSKEEKQEYFLNKIKFVEGNFDPITTVVKPEYMQKLGMAVREIAIKHGLYERTPTDSWKPYNLKEEIKIPPIPSVEQLPKRVTQIIAEQLGVKQEEVTPTASFIDDLGADSLDTVELVMALEEEFGIEIPDEDAEKITAVAEAIKYIQEKITKKHKI